MSYKFDSLIRILNEIDSGRKVTVQALMEELDVSERTIYRYVETLTQAGFPLFYDKDKGRYNFADGYTLKQPNLSLEEALTFALARNLLKNLGTGLDNNLEKIAQKLSMKSADTSQHIVLKGEARPAPIQNIFERVYQSILKNQMIEIEYSALHSRIVSTRKVAPYYIFLRNEFSYLRGFCHECNEMRTFALDGIKKLNVLNEYFVPDGLSPDQELSASFGAWLDGKPETVVLHFDGEVRAQILRKQWHPSQKTRKMTDGRVELIFKVNGIGGIRPWIYNWLPYVEVISPDELRSTVLRDIEATKKKHTSKKGKRG